MVGNGLCLLCFFFSHACTEVGGAVVALRSTVHPPGQAIEVDRQGEQTGKVNAFYDLAAAAPQLSVIKIVNYVRFHSKP